MNLHDKTPQQLNMMVAEIKFPDAVNIGASSYSDSAYVQFKDGDKDFMIEWINDDALAFGLMVDSGIHANPCELSGDKVTRWSCHKRADQCVNSAKLNRAIVECFILMNQNKEA